ncbi:hypothetical protein PCANC_26090 [Puccinia coronata f. sp. avenae]|uniref:Uncharacterized protein n=1 Tax=Puccinia coronata f. sp. avenae TaxID=200324 RepID=A0A2N5TJF4_9BASI|nr:hypothetical protein PCANC_26090 [Puccinia coronata f. sp. avenae]
MVHQYFMKVKARYRAGIPPELRIKVNLWHSLGSAPSSPLVHQPSNTILTPPPLTPPAQTSAPPISFPLASNICALSSVRASPPRTLNRVPFLRLQTRVKNCGPTAGPIWVPSLQPTSNFMVASPHLGTAKSP